MFFDVVGDVAFEHGDGLFLAERPSNLAVLLHPFEKPDLGPFLQFPLVGDGAFLPLILVSRHDLVRLHVVIHQETGFELGENEVFELGFFFFQSKPGFNRKAAQ